MTIREYIDKIKDEQDALVSIPGGGAKANWVVVSPAMARAVRRAVLDAATIYVLRNNKRRKRRLRAN